jgi:hypothetical protein
MLPGNSGRILGDCIQSPVALIHQVFPHQRVIVDLDSEIDRRSRLGHLGCRHLSNGRLRIRELVARLGIVAVVR